MLELTGDVLTQVKEEQTVLSKLKAARIMEVDEKGYYVSDGLIVHCMFNPYEYSISKSNSFEEKSAANQDSPTAELSQSGAQTLKLNLFFDTSLETDEAKKNVTRITNDLWRFMSVKEAKANRTRSSAQEKKQVPLVAFHWGVFFFVAYITDMTQQFIHFLPNGTPVRAKVDVTFKQLIDIDDYPKQNPTSGGGPLKQIWRVNAGDRLDLIAARVYQDAGKWRKLADYNKLVDPSRLRPGQNLLIPFE
jgi:nucleoid-associated protein YgaU